MCNIGLLRRWIDSLTRDEMNDQERGQERRASIINRACTARREEVVVTTSFHNRDQLCRLIERLF